MDYFKGSITPVEKVLKDSSTSKTKVDEVVLVGGSTRIPKVQELIQEFFDGKKPCRSINPDEAVAYGAAVQAAILNGDGGDACKDVLLLDVAPLSLGLQLTGDVFAKIIERNTTIPCKKSDTFTTDHDNQTCVQVCIYEGERYKCKDNNLLGKFDLDGILPAPRGVPQIEVTYTIDANGILNVTAKDKASAKKNNITIKNDKGRLSQEEIERMIEEAEAHKHEDSALQEKTKSRQDLENYCHSLREALKMEGLMGKLTDEEQEQLQTIVDDGLEWVEQNEDVEKNAFGAKKKEIETSVKPLYAKMTATTTEKKKKVTGGRRR